MPCAVPQALTKAGKAPGPRHLMSGSFDPYHKWLGISPKDQPPHHYRLLGIDLFESDPDVISSAADQRMAHVRAFQTGKHSALSQQILNEIAAARVCLLNPEKRVEYDQQLRGQLDGERGESEPVGEEIEAPREPPGFPPLPPAVPPLDEPVAPRFEGSLPQPRLGRRRAVWQALAGFLVAAILLLAILIAVLGRGGPDDVVQGGPSPPPITDPKPPEVDPETGGGTGTQEGNGPEEKLEPPAANQGGTSELDPPPENAKEAEKDPPDEPPDEGIGQVEGQPANPPENASQKAPVPDAATLADTAQRLEGIIAASSGAEFLAAARAEQRTAEERFVLLRKARDVAAGEADVETALAATDEMVARYEVDALAEQAETFGALGASATSPSTLRTLAEQGLELVDEAHTQGHQELALELIKATIGLARKSGDNALLRQAVVRHIELQPSP